MVAALVKFATRAAWALLGITIGGACVGVPLRPDGSPVEEECPKGAIEAMKALRLRPGDAIPVHVDATRQDDEPLIVYDGPVESISLGVNTAELPGHTRLYGRIWTGGPRVTIRYYSARLPDGKVIPFCAMAGDNGPGLPKSPGQPGFAALKFSTAFVFTTGRLL